MTEEQAREVEAVANIVDETQPVDVDAEEPAEIDEENDVAPEDELEALRRELSETQGKEAEYLDGWQRARAELANARKRFRREQEQAYTTAKVNIFAQLLPIVDDLGRAFDTLPEELVEHDWVEGAKLVQHKFQRLLEQEAIESIEAVGTEFDPFLHEAVTHEPSDKVPAGHVIAELQKGYKMGDRVLRPSVVRVSAGMPSEAEKPLDEPATEQQSDSNND